MCGVFRPDKAFTRGRSPEPFDYSGHGVRLFVPRETAAGELRVALTPETVDRLRGSFEVCVERGAGAGAGFADEAYTAAGATLVDAGWNLIVFNTSRTPVSGSELIHVKFVAGRAVCDFEDCTP